MNFNSAGLAPGDRVVVHLPNGTTEHGIIKQVSWVKLAGRHPKAEYYVSMDCGMHGWYNRDALSYEFMKNTCECGASSTHQPGHSWWCPTFDPQKGR